MKDLAKTMIPNISKEEKERIKRFLDARERAAYSWEGREAIEKAKQDRKIEGTWERAKKHTNK